MSAFKECFPASFEVTFLPLILAYVFFILGIPQNLYVGFMGPMLYGLLCAFFIVGDALNGITLKLLLAKVTFALASLTPAALVFWKGTHV